MILALVCVGDQYEVTFALHLLWPLAPIVNQYIDKLNGENGNGFVPCHEQLYIKMTLMLNMSCATH